MKKAVTKATVYLTIICQRTVSLFRKMNKLEIQVYICNCRQCLYYVEPVSWKKMSSFPSRRGYLRETTSLYV